MPTEFDSLTNVRPFSFTKFMSAPLASASSTFLILSSLVYFNRFALAFSRSFTAFSAALAALTASLSESPPINNL